MGPFKNSLESHAHSRTILDLLYEYDDFMDSITVVADMGCGDGQDMIWWNTLYNREDPPEPHDYHCYAVDKNISRLDESLLGQRFVMPVLGDFEQVTIPEKIDMLWCHDAFQFALNPLATLKRWNENMNVNGMMVLSLPQQQVYEYNRLVTRSYNGMYHNYNVCNLMYMLAVNGFDCRDSYILKEENVPWITMAVYKSDVAPMAPENTTWYDLADCNLINDSVIDCLNKFGHVRQEMLLFNWLDKNFVFAKD